jgi:hypothetical protein
MLTFRTPGTFKFVASCSAAYYSVSQVARRGHLHLALHQENLVFLDTSGQLLIEKMGISGTTLIDFLRRISLTLRAAAA